MLFTRALKNSLLRNPFSVFHSTLTISASVTFWCDCILKSVCKFSKFFEAQYSLIITKLSAEFVLDHSSIMGGGGLVQLWFLCSFCTIMEVFPNTDKEAEKFKL